MVQLLAYRRSLSCFALALVFAHARRDLRRSGVRPSGTIRAHAHSAHSAIPRATTPIITIGTRAAVRAERRVQAGDFARLMRP